jgi:hypothetical protein
MRSCVILIAVACLAAEAGCTKRSTQATTTDALGVRHYTASHASQHVVCDGHPFVPKAKHTDMTPTSARFVITGAHNEVTWR